MASIWTKKFFPEQTWIEKYAGDSERRRKRMLFCKWQGIISLVMSMLGLMMAMFGWTREEPIFTPVPNTLFAGFGVLILVTFLLAGVGAEIEDKLLQIVDKMEKGEVSKTAN